MTRLDKLINWLQGACGRNVSERALEVRVLKPLMSNVGDVFGDPDYAGVLEHPWPAEFHPVAAGRRQNASMERALELLGPIALVIVGKVPEMKVSGTEQRHHEALGLVAALVNSGAEYVTATRWALPTDGYCGDATTRLALAVDHAHQQPDPIADLSRRQRERMNTWLSNPKEPTKSPLIWAASTTFRARATPTPNTTPHPHRGPTS
jgi:hypothetical protein